MCAGRLLIVECVQGIPITNISREAIERGHEAPEQMCSCVSRVMRTKRVFGSKRLASREPQKDPRTTLDRFSFVRAETSCLVAFFGTAPL